jgi:lipid-A-disaccharide synthase
MIDDQRPKRVFVTAGEPSGDQLGAALITGVRAEAPSVMISGVGGPLMEAEGLSSLFPMSDLSVMGLVPVIKRLPLLLRRIKQTADAIIAAKPDVVVLIDAQDFSKRVAKRVRKLAPDIPLIGYVAPTVWAWRPKRAQRLKPLFDAVLAVLPFEPAVMQRLGGPPTHYVGHVLTDRLADYRRLAQKSWEKKTVLLLPGSRRSEVGRLLPVFGAVAAALDREQPGTFQFVLPTVPHLAAMVTEITAFWPVKPRISTAEADKWQAFFSAEAALAASGTVTLELALAGVPMVAGYLVPAIEAAIVKRLVMVDTPILPDLILKERHVPFFLQDECTPSHLLNALRPLLEGGSEAKAQKEAFARLWAIMLDGEEGAPRKDAARLVLSFADGSV